MVGCSALNCSNKSTGGHRLFRFPTDIVRKEIWVQNCKRCKWRPTINSRLCEAHFDANQWELDRADNWKKLKPYAVPTLFDMPIRSTRYLYTRRSKYKVRNMEDDLHEIKEEKVDQLHKSDKANFPFTNNDTDDIQVGVEPVITQEVDIKHETDDSLFEGEAYEFAQSVGKFVSVQS